MISPCPLRRRPPTAPIPSAHTRISHPTQTHISVAAVRTAPGRRAVRLLVPLPPALARIRPTAGIPHQDTLAPLPGHTATRGPARASNSARSSPMSAVGTCSLRTVIALEATRAHPMRRMGEDGEGHIRADRAIWRAEIRARHSASSRSWSSWCCSEGASRRPRRMRSRRWLDVVEMSGTGRSGRSCNAWDRGPEGRVRSDRRKGMTA